jgi:hypothetical protein
MRRSLLGGSGGQSLALVRVVGGADRAVEREGLLQLLLGLRTAALGRELFCRSPTGFRFLGLCADWCRISAAVAKSPCA